MLKNNYRELIGQKYSLANLDGYDWTDHYPVIRQDRIVAIEEHIYSFDQVSTLVLLATPAKGKERRFRRCMRYFPPQKIKG